MCARDLFLMKFGYVLGLVDMCNWSREHREECFVVYNDYFAVDIIVSSVDIFS